MGMFDRIWFTCPNCGNQIEEQSKAGKCALTDFDASAVPPEIAVSIEDDVIYCTDRDEAYGLEAGSGCGKSFKVKATTPIMTVVMELVPYDQGAQ